jgi:hypothetical protein
MEYREVKLQRGRDVDAEVPQPDDRHSQGAPEEEPTALSAVSYFKGAAAPDFFCHTRK